jgi:hypothetical protein
MPLSDLQARAKTVRIGKVRWPPPLKESETFENELQRRLELQRRIQEEILTSSETSRPSLDEQQLELQQQLQVQHPAMTSNKQNTVSNNQPSSCGQIVPNQLIIANGIALSNDHKPQV